MVNNEMLRTIFGLTNQNILPIAVTIGGQVFIHNMPEDLVVGIMVGYNSVGQEHPLSLFG